MVQKTTLKARDIVFLMGTDGPDDWPLGYAVVLRDFDIVEVHEKFSMCYTGPSYDFSGHYLDYLIAHKYLMIGASDSYRLLYL